MLAENIADSIRLCTAARMLRLQARTVRAMIGAERRESPFRRITCLARGANDQPAVPQAAAPGRLILIVDDSLDAREMYGKFFRFHGWQVVDAADGEQALAIAADRLPDAVVMDLGLPRLDGWEVIRRLKLDPWTKGMPVIALSGHAFADARERARQAGCDVFLAKPCVPDELLKALRTVLPDSR